MKRARGVLFGWWACVVGAACSSGPGAGTDATTRDARVGDALMGAEIAGPRCGDGVLDPGEACDGDEVACTDLGALFSGGRAPCRATCTGYDVSACARDGADARWEAVKPAQRDPARWPHALCNDGTPFALRVRLSATGSKAWVFTLRGGAQCDDLALPCAFRPLERTTTTPQADGEFFAPDDKPGGVFSRDPAQNPAWHDANHVFGAYCSSDMWAGARTERRDTTGSPEGWFFAGRWNADAMLGVVIARYGLDPADPATRALWAGESAGGVGVWATVDLALARLPRLADDGRLAVLVDAGWVVSDWDDPAARLGLAKVSDLEVLRHAYDWYGSTLNPACEAARAAAGGHPGDCLAAAFHAPLLVDPPPAGRGLPVLVLQSLQDDELNAFHGIVDEPDKVAAYAQRFLAESEAVAWLFAADQPYHSVIFKPERWDMGGPGHTLRDLLAAFWAGDAPRRVIWRP